MDAGREKPRAFRRAIITGFLLFHLVAIACWAVPLNFMLIADLRDQVRAYMLWSGLFQSWDTFAPNPPTANSFVRAVVETREGHIKVWTFPRKERYRKFAEVMLQPANAGLWPDIAKHIARLMNDPGDPPIKVILAEYLAGIPPANTEQAPGKTIAFFEQPIQAEDLK